MRLRSGPTIEVERRGDRVMLRIVSEPHRLVNVLFQLDPDEAEEVGDALFLSGRRAREEKEGGT